MIPTDPDECDRMWEEVTATELLNSNLLESPKYQIIPEVSPCGLNYPLTSKLGAWNDDTFKGSQCTNNRIKSHMLKKNFSSENKCNRKTVSSYQYFREKEVFYKPHQINLRKP